MSVMTCPKCKLENPETAQRCDCGYDFLAKEMRQSYLEIEKQRRAPKPSDEVRDRGRRDMVLGAACFIVGLAVTTATYAYARQHGGRYTIASGLMVWGVIWFIRGVERSRSGIERTFWRNS